MWTLYDIVKRGFEDGPLSFLYKELWKKEKKRMFHKKNAPSSV
jgi:hypothetical protein